MSKDKLTDYDATAGNNTDIGGISVDEGMLPSNVNNALRELMSHLKDFAAGTEAVDAVAVNGDLSLADKIIHTGDTDTAMRFPAADTISFETSGSERLRILSSGGLTFNGDTAAANALDDYEEGTWTPTYSGSTTNPTVSYTEQHGEYVKIGRQVIARLELKTSSFSGGSGVVTVGGLPFTTTSSDGTRSGNLIVGYSQGFASTTHAPQTGYASANTTSIVLGHRASDTGANAELSGTFTMSNWSSSGNNFLMATLIYTAT